ncbi:hypothetical protein Clacol_008172 [Clathrus columnatus]|uniref:Carbohydrate kinase PfkB domain-containing protein n=1 Tax=Clathrus columnatus TaxID=1419009 RepID=A0AAV5APT4_9AGAM|nr:hypothetical protein Clacol_008172 [Clathrus columnatus]
MIRNLIRYSCPGRKISPQRLYYSLPTRFIDIAPEVEEALNSGLPVVALESTIITHGMPYPINLTTAVSVEAQVRSTGAIPATIAILKGRIVVGMSRSQLEHISDAQSGARDLIKVSRRDLATMVGLKLSGGTTISATSLIASSVGIKVFATGGLGGVHRGGEITWDVSADLTELGRTPIAVVSAGIKSILDVERTLEYLETQGVAVITYGPDRRFPGFYIPDSGYKSPWNVNSPEEAAMIIDAVDALGLKSGVLFAAPIPESHSKDAAVIQDAVDKAVKESEEKGVNKLGRDATPWILRRVAELSKGKSLPSSILDYSKPPLSDPKPLVVIGGAAVDVICQRTGQNVTVPDDLCTTFPGEITFHTGGVARNIAEAAHRILSTSENPSEAQVLLISPLANDFAGTTLVNDCERLGMPTDGLFYKSGRSATCTQILDLNKNLVTGIADMSIMETMEFDSVWFTIFSSFFEPTSIPRSVSILAAIEKVLQLEQYQSSPVNFASPNHLELSHMFETMRLSENTLMGSRFWWSVMDDLTLEETYRSDLAKFSRSIHIAEGLNFLEKGIPQMAVSLIPFFKHLFVKLGKHGVLVVMRLVGDKANGWMNERTSFEKRQVLARGKDSVLVLKHYSAVAFKQEIVNVTGAGDSFVGSLLTDLMWDELLCPTRLDEIIDKAQCAAVLSLTSAEAVSPRLQYNSRKNLFL